MSLPQFDELKDPALFAEVELARAAAQEEAGDEEVGAHVETQVEGDAAVTHLFDAAKSGYRGWRWAATVSSAGPGTNVTVSEVVLLPGPDALVAPDWVPWENRVQAGDLGVGDLMPTAPDDPRLVPAYAHSDDPAVEEVALETGLGRVRVMAREAREDAAARWRDSPFGPRSDMARSAPAHCGTCGFYLPLAGSLRAAFGTCGNEISPADGHVVHAEYGCGAHSEAEVEQVSPVLVANLIYDDAQLDVEPLVPSARGEARTREEEPTTEAALNGAGPVASSPDEPTTQAEPVEVDSSGQAEVDTTEAVDTEPADPSEPATEVETTETTSSFQAEAPELAGVSRVEPSETATNTTEAVGSTQTDTPQPEATESASSAQTEVPQPETTESASSVNGTQLAGPEPTDAIQPTEPAEASQPDTTESANPIEPVPVEATRPALAEPAEPTQAEPTESEAVQPAAAEPTNATQAEPTQAEPTQAEATPSEPASAAPDSHTPPTFGTSPPPEPDDDDGADPRPTEG